MKSLSLFILLYSIGLFIPKDEVIKITWKNYQGQEIEDIYGIGSKTYFYESEKLTKLEFRDKAGNLIPEEKTISFYPAVFKYHYDAKGNYISREAYNISGNLMDLDGYYDSSILRFKYNAENQLIERTTLDKEHKLLEMGDSKIARITYEYDSQERLETLTNYDATGNVLAGKAKYSYLEGGKPETITYWGKSGTISSKISFAYDDDGSLQGYSQVYPEDEDELSVQFTYLDSVYTGLSIRSKKSSFEKIKKRGLKIELDGWFLEDSLLLKTFFQHSGEGQYKMTLSPDGNVQNLEPLRVRASNEFNQEVYELFRSIQFKRNKEIDPPTLDGKVQISILEPFSGFELLEFLKHPKPND